MDMRWIVAAYIHCDDDAENILITGNVLPRFPVVALYVQILLGSLLVGLLPICHRREEVVLESSLADTFMLILPFVLTRKYQMGLYVIGDDGRSTNRRSRIA